MGRLCVCSRSGKLLALLKPCVWARAQFHTLTPAQCEERLPSCSSDSVKPEDHPSHLCVCLPFFPPLSPVSTPAQRSRQSRGAVVSRLSTDGEAGAAQGHLQQIL